MKKVLVGVILCVIMFCGCGENESRQSQKVLLPSMQTIVNTNKAMQTTMSQEKIIIENISEEELQKKILAQMNTISSLWTNNIRQAYQEIQKLSNSNPTSFFQSVEMCEKYVSFMRGLKISDVPLKERDFIINRSYFNLSHILYESIKSYPKNNDFLFIIHADYLHKLNHEYTSICDLLKKIPQPPSLPLLQYNECGKPIRIIPIERRQEYLNNRNKVTEYNNITNTLINYKKSISYQLEKYPINWFDAEFRKNQIMQIPEPRRTELIRYIEERIGRKMKWRK